MKWYTKVGVMLGSVTFCIVASLILDNVTPQLFPQDEFSSIILGSIFGVYIGIKLIK